jgi:hypothetical protein
MSCRRRNDVERRVTVIVALFVGVLALLGTWLLLTTDPTVPASDTRARIDGEMDDDVRAALARERELKIRSDPRLAGPGSREVTVGRPGATADHLRNRMRGAGEPTGSSAFALDDAGIADAVDTRRAALEDCYATALLHAPDLPPSLTLSLVVTPSPGASWGHVTAVDAGVDDADVFETCAEGALGTVRFSASEPSTVTVPVDLGQR